MTRPAARFEDEDTGEPEAEATPLAKALAQLEQAMRPAPGAGADPERRRVASRLSDLARCEDGELSAFAQRHLPGRSVDEPTLRAAREMMLAIGRVLGPEGGSAEKLRVLSEMQRALDERLSAARDEAASGTGNEAAPRNFQPAEAPRVASEPLAASLPPPTRPVPSAIPERQLQTLPFVAMQPSPVAVPIPPPSPAPPAFVAPPSSRHPEPPWRPAPEPDREGTAVYATALAAPALPFGTTQIPEERKTRPAHLVDALPFGAKNPRPSPDLEQTAVGFQPAEKPRAREPSVPGLPFEAAQRSEASKQVQGFSLAQYAEVYATLTAFPAHVEQIRSRYGLDQHAWAALHSLWQERFRRDPALVPRWEIQVKAALQRLRR